MLCYSYHPSSKQKKTKNDCDIDLTVLRKCLRAGLKRSKKRNGIHSNLKIVKQLGVFGPQKPF